MTKLDNEQASLLSLILRSPDHGDGWRSVSPVLWNALVPRMNDDLVEKEPATEGGRIRLTERGKIVCDHLV